MSNLSRSDLIRYKNKTLNFDYNSITVNFPFDFNHLKINKILNGNFFTIQQKYNLSLRCFLNTIFKMQSNISSLLIHNIFNKRFHSSNFYSFRKCSDNSCIICLRSNPNSFIFLTNNFHLPIMSNSSCSSSNFIYMIFCKKCKCFYIRQSERTVKIRMKEHLSNIRNFKAYVKNVTVVSNHFNLLEHNFDHFSSLILI